MIHTNITAVSRIMKKDTKCYRKIIKMMLKTKKRSLGDPTKVKMVPNGTNKLQMKVETQ